MTSYKAMGWFLATIGTIEAVLAIAMIGWAVMFFRHPGRKG